MAKVLIVDDDKDIAEVISLVLKKEQIDSSIINDSSKALEVISSKNFDYDLILLDIMMPGLSGTEVCSRVRDIVNIPIIFVSAKSEMVDKIVGYEIGGDDYITKPFDNTELVLKVKSHLRLNKRSNLRNVGNIIKIGEISLNTESFEVKKNDKRVDLSTREFELLRYLMENAGIALSKEQIFENVWGSEYGDIGTVAVNIKSVRDKLEDNDKYILTIWGYGYKFVRVIDDETNI
ncbi:MAG: response regulator transcription factor [Mycoplasmatota bacterium]|nr:response regulator transcription factor [Mycoplasmatota bacterium]